jgi:hypothetical protein
MAASCVDPRGSRHPQPGPQSRGGARERHRRLADDAHAQRGTGYAAGRRAAHLDRPKLKRRALEAHLREHGCRVVGGAKHKKWRGPPAPVLIRGRQIHPSAAQTSTEAPSAELRLALPVGARPVAGPIGLVSGCVQPRAPH